MDCTECSTSLSSGPRAALCAACADQLHATLTLSGERGALMVQRLQAAQEEATTSHEAARKAQAEVVTLRSLLTATEEQAQAMLREHETLQGTLRTALKERRKSDSAEARETEALRAEVAQAQRAVDVLRREGREAVAREKAAAAATLELRTQLSSALERVAELQHRAALTSGPGPTEPSSAAAALPIASPAADHRAAELLEEAEAELGRTRERLHASERACDNLKHAITKLLEEHTLLKDEVDSLKLRQLRDGMANVAEGESPPRSASASLLDELSPERNVSPAPPAPVREAGPPLDAGEAYQFFVHLCCQSVKVSLQMQEPDKAEQIAAIDTKMLYYQALVESIPFHELFDWVRLYYSHIVLPPAGPPPPVKIVAQPKKKSLWAAIFSSPTKRDLADKVGNVAGPLLLHSRGKWTPHFFMLNTDAKKLLWSVAQGSDFIGALPLVSIRGVSVAEGGQKYSFHVHCVDDTMSLLLAAEDNDAFQTWIHLLAKIA